MTLIGFLTEYHTFWKGEPYCPVCGSLNVTERGFDHNHRHDCRACGKETWITND